MDTIKKIEAIAKHIAHVKENCYVIGEKLVEQGSAKLGIKLIQHGEIHDNSKFGGIEFEYLNDESKITYPDKFEMAYQQHVKSNPHHIEYWHEPLAMPPVYVAELTADCAARASEFGTDIRSWFKEQFCEKYKISKCGKFYKQIIEFLDLLLEKPFKNGNTK